MMDKSKELRTSLTLLNDRLHFSGSTIGREPISIDYIPPLGDDQVYTSLELLLLSLSSCVGSAVLTFLRKMNRNIDRCSIEARGFRREEHPTGFRSILLDIELESADVTPEDMHKVIALTEDKYCPVYSMIRGNTEVEIRYTIKGK